MSLNYKGVQRKNPQQPEDPRLWYPALIKASTINDRILMSKIANEAGSDHKEMDYLISHVFEIISKELLNGNTVQIGDMGCFYLTANSKPGSGVASEEEVNIDQIDCVKLRFMVSPTFRKKLDMALLERKNEE